MHIRTEIRFKDKDIFEIVLNVLSWVNGRAFQRSDMKCLPLFGSIKAEWTCRRYIYHRYRTLK